MTGSDDDPCAQALSASPGPWQAAAPSAPIGNDRHVAFLALGSNLSWRGLRPAEILAAAQAQLRQCYPLIAASSLYVSAAWPDPAEPAYLNAVLALRTADGPETVLKAAHALEAAFGRTRRRRWAARSLDVDLVAQGCETRPSAQAWAQAAQGDQPPSGLILPHPRAHLRTFVLAPLAQIAPAWRHPTLCQNAADLLAALAPAQACEPIGWRQAMALH
ncbi:MAG: 2-amino-4-hydroxy-6-hydroxymethyldihydropteridine diphosphokinase [Rhodothalassiaceae bacterium]